MIITLRKIVQRVSKAETAEQSMVELVRLTRQALYTDCCSIYLIDQGELLLCASEGLSQAAMGQTRLALGEGIVGLVGKRHEPVNIANASEHPAFKFLPELVEESFQAILAVPLVHRRRLVGVLVVQQKVARLFSDEEESFLITLASQLAGELKSNRYKITPSTLHQAMVASPGIAFAKGHIARKRHRLEQPQQRADSPEQSWRQLERALKLCADELTLLSERFEEEANSPAGMIFECYQALLTDPVLLKKLKQACEEGWSAVTAVCNVTLDYAAQFAQLPDEYLRERADDLKELGRRLLDHLLSPQAHLLQQTTTEPVILIAKEISAPMLAEYPRSALAGVISFQGGVNSHAAILARAMGLPALVAIEGVDKNELTDKPLLLDAMKGQLFIEPDLQVEQTYRAWQASLAQQQEKYEASLQHACQSHNGESVRLQLNAGFRTAEEVRLDCVEGIGLYRTESLFMSYDQFPNEQQQERVYRQLLKTCSPKRAVIRTLDIGGDKPLTYLPIREDNPFLGWRGIRVSLDHPDLFLVQCRALLRASMGLDNLSILLPMISGIDEIKRAKTLLWRAKEELEEELQQPICQPQIGIMIEVPAALHQLKLWQQEVDFFSVGSNDLTQYLLAVDRNNAQVGNMFDSYHPSVVSALDLVIQQSGHLEVSLCGELAAEVEGALLLLALGYRSLSMNGFALGRIHYLIRHLDFGLLPSLRQTLLCAEDGDQVRFLLRQFLQANQLESLVQI